jgi:hypothetical protein
MSGPLQVRNHRNIVILEPCDISRAIDDRDGASCDAFIGEIDSEFVAHRSARLKIREQRILNPHFFRVSFVRPGAIDADTHHLRVELLEFFHVIHEAGVLVRAGWAPIQRIEYEDDILFALEVRQLYFFLALILQREIRRRCSHRNCHALSSVLSR